MEALGSLADEFWHVENIKGKNKSKLDVYRKMSQPKQTRVKF